MRCPHCELPNEEGVAVCQSCGMPLTVYGRQVTGEVSEATRAKIAQLAVRPAIVPVMAAFCAVAALFGPIWSILSRFFGRAQVNSEGTNYLGAAFGAVGIALAALVLVPLAIVMLVVSWGILTQRTWAWGAGLVVLIGALFAAFTNYFFAGPLKFVMIVAALAFSAMWFRKDAREWYGAA
jgi:hypothetical protein